MALPLLFLEHNNVKIGVRIFGSRRPDWSTQWSVQEGTKFGLEHNIKKDRRF